MACAPNVAIAPASSKTPSAREPTRSTSESCNIDRPQLGAKAVLLPLLDNHPPLSTQIHAIHVPVLARRGVVGLGQLLDSDDLAARQSLKGDHRCQILLERFLVLGKRR